MTAFASTTLKVARRSGEVGFLDQLGTDRGMRTGHHALVALDALRGIPLRHARSDAALFKSGGCGRHGAVVAHRRNRNLIALLVEDRLHQGVREHAHVVGDGFDRFKRGDAVERSRDFDLLQHRERLVDAGLIFLDDVVALLLELLLDTGLDVADRLIRRDDVRQLEEAGLHDGRHVLGAADFERELERVDGVDLHMFPDDGFLHVAGEALEHLGRPGVRC